MKTTAPLVVLSALFFAACGNPEGRAIPLTNLYLFHCMML